MINYRNGINENVLVSTIPNINKNHYVLFTTDTGVEGRLCIGGSGPRLEVFLSNQGSLFDGHICGCSLEVQKEYLGRDSDGKVKKGCQYGYFDLLDISLGELIKRLTPKWKEELKWKMKDALGRFEGIEKLEKGL